MFGRMISALSGVGSSPGSEPIKLNLGCGQRLLPGAAGTVKPPPAPSPAPAPLVSSPPAHPPVMDVPSKNELRAQVALTQIVLGLHRAVVREYARAYRQALVPEAGPWSAGPASAERGELAAQFELEMMENPPASRLRELWDLVGALERGILFPTGRRVGALGAAAAAVWAAPQVRDQGARELVALNGICNAHQRISGELSGVSTDLSQATRDLQRVAGIDLKLADAMKPATAAAKPPAAAAKPATDPFGWGRVNFDEFFGPLPQPAPRPAPPRSGRRGWR